MNLEYPIIHPKYDLYFFSRNFRLRVQLEIVETVFMFQEIHAKYLFHEFPI